MTMSPEEHKKRVVAFVNQIPDAVMSPPYFSREEGKKGLEEALYSVNELRCWPDSDIELDSETVLAAWKLVEAVRRKRFPKELSM